MLSIVLRTAKAETRDARNPQKQLEMGVIVMNAGRKAIRSGFAELIGGNPEKFQIKIPMVAPFTAHRIITNAPRENVFEIHEILAANRVISMGMVDAFIMSRRRSLSELDDLDGLEIDFPGMLAHDLITVEGEYTGACPVPLFEGMQVRFSVVFHGKEYETLCSDF